MKPLFALSCLSLCVAARAADSVLVGDHQLGVTLDRSHNWALTSVWVRDTEFPSGGKFPCFVLFDQDGKVKEYPAQDSRWKAKGVRRKIKNWMVVSYKHAGFSAVVTYKVEKKIITVSVQPTNETGGLKIRALTDGGSLVTVPSNVPGAESTAFLLRPHFSGEVIRFPANHESKTATEAQSWDHQATFFGVGYNGRGLIVRLPQYGAVWTAGAGDVNGVYSLFGGLSADFRPRRDNPGPYTFWNLPLVEPRVDIWLAPVDDTNGDGVFNWVDIGVAYRKRFIGRNRHLDKSELESVGGKIDTWGAVPTYSELIKQIRTIDFDPQRWWLVGAHVPVGNDFTVPPYSDYPDPSHNGPAGYDYFAFKRDAAKAGAKIGLHEIFQDICPLNKNEWGKVPLRKQEYGADMGTWNGNTPSGVVWDVSKALNVTVKDGSFFRSLDRHFKNWDVRPGDSWHWDCFTAFGGRADFSPEHPTTHGKDIRDRIEILKYIEKKGIYMASEGLQEGLAQYCDFAWSAKTEPGWSSSFAAGEVVPLVPVLFQGMTYYYVSWHPAWNLLMGGKMGYEATSLDRESIRKGYVSSNAYWKKIANRTVENMIKTDEGWRVEYTDGGSLTVDLANMTPAMTFVLEIEGKKYTSK